MSFLNRLVLQERAAAATVEKHPLLKECDVPQNVKQAYLQGCVLAVLERDDGKVTDAARQELLKLGKSLELSDADCAEAISIVSALQTPEDQGQFLDELFPVLSGEIYPKFFMRDFQSLIAKGGQMADAKKQTVDYFGKSLTGQADWLKVLETPGQVSTDKRAQNYVDVPLAYRSTADVVWAIKEHPFHCDLPIGGPASKLRDCIDSVSTPRLREILVTIFDYSTFDNWDKERDECLKRMVRESICEMGLGLKRDFSDGSLTIELPRTEVADRLYVEGEYEIGEGVKYYDGVDVNRDYHRAYEYFRHCLGSAYGAQANYMMATMRFDGKVRMQPDLVRERKEALVLLRLSAEFGYAPAIDLMRQMECSASLVVGDVLNDDDILRGIAEAAGVAEATYGETLAELMELTEYGDVECGDVLDDLVWLLAGKIPGQFGINMSKQEEQAFCAAKTVGDLVEYIRNKKILI